MYRRGVASDTGPFSRPLPLCGKTRGPSVLPVSDAPPLVRPRGAAEIGWCDPVVRDESSRTTNSVSGPSPCKGINTLV